jgi:glycerol-3-phosphate O-acyltransferase/dihydroxyacetone phosphate acyltransferase
MKRPRIRIHPVLRFIYLFFRIISWLGIKVFYRRRVVLGKENFRFEGPAIVIVNHPSTLLDVLNPGIEIRQEMFFLANYGLFRHPVSNWLLRRLFCIPVMRAEDQRAGEPRDNSMAFEMSFQHMEREGILFVAAEGVSWMNRFVRPLKTGAARIALTSERRNGWNLNVKIIPVGLSYSAPHLFRSDVVVQAGPPVYARDWAAAFKNDPEGAIDAMTDYLESLLKQLSIHTRDEEGEVFITRLEAMAEYSKPLPLKAAFERTQRLTAKFLDNDTLRSGVDGYYQLLQGYKVDDQTVAMRGAPGGWLATFANAFILTLGAPLFLLGAAFWFLPCFLPWLLNRRLNFYIGYSSTVKILAGLITFPAALWAAYRVLFQVTGSPWQATAGSGALVLLGYFCEYYLGWAANMLSRIKAFRLPVDKAAMLLQLRNAMLKQIL